MECHCRGSNYEQLDNILSTAPGIDRITKRIFRGREISFFLLSRMNPEKLVKIIEKSDLQGFSLKFDNAALDRIEFRVIK